MSLVDLPSLALILAALARGSTCLRVDDSPGLPALARALVALGATIHTVEPGVWQVQGRGTGGWCEPDRVLDLEACSTAAPLLAGALASHDMNVVLSAESVALTDLRPALERLGARLTLRSGDRLPGVISGTRWPLPALHAGLVPQAGMAMLLAGLNSPGRTGVDWHPDLDPGLELMRQFGAVIRVEAGNAWVDGYPDLRGTEIGQIAVTGAR